MATILELGHINDGNFQPLPLECYTPIYYDSWEMDFENSIIYNKEAIKFNVNVDEKTTFNCLAMTILGDASEINSHIIKNIKSGDFDLLWKFELNFLFSDVENQAILAEKEIRINVS